ncbi:MAG TPA: septum formation initiator family protein [Elusimicrobiota bacterium]|jgi:cell division protein FtsB|nr:septum formation initiator family protein [Elusimicrobiota bacterium]
MPAKPARLHPRERRALVFSILGAAGVAILLGNRGFRRMISGTVQLRGLNREMARLKTEETSLQKQIAAATQDERAIESAARRELGYLKPGEIEYRFPPPK